MDLHAEAFELNDVQRASDPPAMAAHEKSVAVLPFTNLSDNRENSTFFSDGMHEDILTPSPTLRLANRARRTGPPHQDANRRNCHRGTIEEQAGMLCRLPRPI
jgi:hypothetical protein